MLFKFLIFRTKPNKRMLGALEAINVGLNSH